MRKTPLQRKTRLVAKHTNGKPRTPIKKVNVARQAKRRRAYAQKLAAYRRSETYQVVKARAGGQCEAFLFGLVRCCERGTQHHHKTYARFGGQELPEDIIVLCADCHAEVETRDHPTRRHGR